jgi:PAS domain S-box-containing protein
MVQRDSAHQELHRLNRTLRVLSECNQTLIHAADELAFLREVCRIIVEVGGYRMAWVGYAEQDGAKKVRPVAHAGFEEGYLAKAEITWADDVLGRGPTGTAIRTGRPTVNRNTETDPTVTTWREELLKRGYACSIGLPFQAGSRLLGALTLYAAEPEAFDDEEIKLLSELAADVGFGIDTIHTRAERQRNAEALQESETRYRSFIAHSMEGVWRVELAKPLPLGLPEDESLEWLFQQGYIAECNPAYARIFGFSTPDELIGKRLGNIVPASDEERIETFRSLARGGFQSRTIEFRASDNAGNMKYLARLDIPIVEDGMLVRLWGITRDLTDLKRAEDAARRSSAEIRDLYNNAPCGYHSLDKDGLFLRMNDTELRWLGYTREEVIGKLNITDILTENSRQVFAKSFPRFKETGLVRDLEFELVRKDGTSFPVIISASVLRDEAGTYVMSRSTVYDMTDRKNAQGAIAAERQRLFDVLDTLPAMICLLTPDYHIAFANRSFREKFGDPQGRKCYESCFGRSAPCEFCESYKALEAGKPHHWEVTAPDGSIIDAHDFPFTDVDGSPMILEMNIDITQRKRAEEALRQLSARLLRTQDDERRRIARELHDSIGQELAALDLNLGWIKQSVGSLDLQTLGVLNESFEIVKRCTREIRDFSYLLYPPMLDDYGLASALRWYTEGFARRTGIQVTLDVPNDLPRRSRDVETALFRVVQECLTNVHRHSGSPTVSIRIAQEANRLCLEVADQGRGLREAAPQDAESRPGTGIAGMRERMRELGGTLEIVSDSHGTTVRGSVSLQEDKAA